MYIFGLISSKLSGIVGVMSGKVLNYIQVYLSFISQNETVSYAYKMLNNYKVIMICK